MSIKKYYLTVNNLQEGPFSIEELKQKGLTKDTLVWFEGAESWRKISEIDELKGIYKVIPPPVDFNVSPIANKIPKKSNKDLIIGSIAIITIIVLGILFRSIFTNNRSKEEEASLDSLAVSQMAEVVADSVVTPTNKLHLLTVHNRKIRNNFQDYLVETHSEPTYGAIGGISNFLIVVSNNTGYKIDEAIYTVTYYNASNDVLFDEKITFYDIENQEVEKMEASGSQLRGSSYSVELYSASSSELNFCYNQFHGIDQNEIDPFYCK